MTTTERLPHFRIVRLTLIEFFVQGAPRISRTCTGRGPRTLRGLPPQPSPSWRLLRARYGSAEEGGRGNLRGYKCSPLKKEKNEQTCFKSSIHAVHGLYHWMPQSQPSPYPPPPNLPQQTDVCAPQEKRTSRTAHATTHKPKTGSSYLLARQLSDALVVPGEDGGARRPCIQKNPENRALGLC